MNGTMLVRYPNGERFLVNMAQVRHLKIASSPHFPGHFAVRAVYQDDEWVTLRNWAPREEAEAFIEAMAERFGAEVVENGGPPDEDVVA